MVTLDGSQTGAARAWLDGTQGLDGADESAALEYDAVGEFRVGHLKIPASPRKVGPQLTT